MSTTSPTIKRLATALLAVSLVASVAACKPTQDGGTGDGASQKPVNGGNLVVASLPSMIDPYTTTSRANLAVAASACEGLFANAADTNINLGLAEKSDYDADKLTYTITLRSGVKFHTGETVSANDVKASLERYMSKDPGKSLKALVKSVDAPDELTVVITVNAPTGVIPALLATPDTGAYIMPASFLAQNTDELSTLDCTGPYKLDSFKVDDSAVLTRFDDYTSRTEPSDGAAGKKTAYTDSLTFVPYNDANIANQLSTGQVNVSSTFNGLDALATYESNPSLTPVLSQGSGFSLIQFNLKEGVFTNEKLRHAVLNSIDPAEIETQNLGSTEHWVDDSSLFPKGSDWYSGAGNDIYKTRSVDTAKDLMKEAGYAGEPIRILYRPTSDNYGPILKQQLEKAGFTVDLQGVDGATFTSTRTDASKWDMFIAGGTAYSDPATVVFLNDDFPGWWQSDAKKQLMTEVNAGASNEERKPSWEKLQELIWTELPFIKLGDEPRMVVVSSTVGGFKPSKGTVRGYYNVWLSQQ